MYIIIRANTASDMRKGIRLVSACISVILNVKHVDTREQDISMCMLLACKHQTQEHTQFRYSMKMPQFFLSIVLWPQAK